MPTVVSPAQPKPTDRPRIAGVLFDLDGTLLDTHDLILASFRHATAHVLGAPLPDERLMAKVGVPLAQQMADFSDDPAVQQRLRDVYRAYNHAHHDEMVREFAGMSRTVDELRKRGMRLGVVTSKRRELALRGLALFEFDGAFEFVIGSDDCERHKPDPEPILMGCGRLGLEPAACVYVGDSPFDLQAARAAGATAVAALWGMFPEGALTAERPDAMCRRPEELLAVV